MSYETIILDRKEGIEYLTINRPKVFNAINNQMIEEMKRAIEEFHQDKLVGVVIITGTGKAFQTGADIEELSQMSPLEILQWNQGVVENFDALEKMRQPVIAAINGYALGGGLELALACTIRIAADSAKMGLPEVKIGILPGAGGTQRLPRLIGKGLAAEMILTGEMIDAKEAYRIGLVNRVVPAEQLMATAEEIGRKILRNAPIAVALAKDAIEVGKNLPLDGAIQYAQKNCITCFSTEDMKEGTAAFLEKRKPQFKGR
ncbi:MAG: enoyl-CoA hydratase/isomerase family protein [Proteobacteria bacterium]|nr:enoyl-CoA hydratase/isomerase family protein [Pseudomonadota bacterium]